MNARQLEREWARRDTNCLNVDQNAPELLASSLTGTRDVYAAMIPLDLRHFNGREIGTDFSHLLRSVARIYRSELARQNATPQ